MRCIREKVLELGVSVLAEENSVGIYKVFESFTLGKQGNFLQCSSHNQDFPLYLGDAFLADNIIKCGYI